MNSHYQARSIVTVGDLEQLAGVENREKFWKQFIPTFEHSGSEDGMKAFSKKCRAMIRQRVKAGEICLCGEVQK